MRLYHYLIKAVQEFVEDACPQKMSDAELMEALVCTGKLRKLLTDELDLNVAEYIISKLGAERKRRGAPDLCKMVADNPDGFVGGELREVLKHFDPDNKKKVLEALLSFSAHKGAKIGKNQQKMMRKNLLGL